MIGANAKRTISSLFDKSVNEAVKQEGKGHKWGIKRASGAESVRAREFIILTITSFDFRIITSLHFTQNSRTRGYVGEVLDIPADQVTRAQFIDCMGEFGNMYCGALKRELNYIFPHLGMSTPDILDRPSFGYMSSLRYEYELHNQAVNENNVSLHFSLYLCPFGDLDFTEPVKHEEVATGELEIF